MWHKSNEQEMCLSSTMYKSTLSTKESMHVSYIRPFIPITLIAPLQLSLFLCHIKRIYIHNVFPYFFYFFFFPLSYKKTPVFINNFSFKHNTQIYVYTHGTYKRKLFNNKNTTENSPNLVYIQDDAIVQHT